MAQSKIERESSSESSADSPPRLPDDDMSETPELLGTASYGVMTMANLKRQFSGRPTVFGLSEGAREPKARRKDHRAGGGGGGGSSGALWDQGSIATARGGARDELVDSALVDQLKSQFGDPFDDTILKKAAATDN
ncbi:hypothetical protein C8Q79DRAFT_521909 [Trametes meyenii]|nr:hypothetical protein C8Q79DRAFT_521909 [Trametes meyenii]